MSGTPPDLVELLKKFFGLNQYEAKAYIALVKKPMRVGQISGAAKIPKPRVYDVVDSLESKGFIRTVGDTLYAVSPQVALPARRAAFRAEFEEEDLRRLRAQTLIVEALRGVGEPALEEPAVLRGFQQVVTLLYELLPRAGEVLLTLNRALDARAAFRGVVAGAVTPRTGLKIMALVPSDARLEKEDLDLIGSLNAEVRATQAVLMDTMVTDTDDVVIGLPDPGSTEGVPVVAVHVRDHSFASSLRETFKKIWLAATPPLTA